MSLCGTYVTHVWPVTRVSSQNAVQHVVIRPALGTQTNQIVRTQLWSAAPGAGAGGRGPEATDLLEDAQVWKGSGDVQLDQLQAGLSI